MQEKRSMKIVKKMKMEGKITPPLHGKRWRKGREKSAWAYTVSVREKRFRVSRRVSRKVGSERMYKDSATEYWGRSGKSGKRICGGLS